jgi:hypothetical protein
VSDASPPTEPPSTPVQRIPATYIADVPAALTDEDAFGHREYAAAVVEILRAAPSSFTLGLFGEWGLGKSSIIDRVGQLLPKEVAFVLVDAWRYDNAEIRRYFIKEVVRQLVDKQQLAKGFDPKKELVDIDADVTETEDKLKFSRAGLHHTLLYAGFAGVVALLFLLLEGKPHLTAGKVTAATFTALVISFVTFLLGRFNQVIKVDQRITAIKRIEEPDRFGDLFARMLKNVKAARLVIAIDNLDRCSPDVVDTLLSTMKTYLEPATEGAGTEILYVIAADDDALRRHLIAREIETRGAFYELQSRRSKGKQEPQPEAEDVPDAQDVSDPMLEAEHYVGEYLRKIFWASIRIRPLLREDMRTYTRSQLAGFIEAASLEDDEATYLVDMVASALQGNPRRIKQFLNSFQARLALIYERQESGQIPTLSDRPLEIAKVAVIEDRWPERYAKLQQQPRVLAEWQRRAESSVDIDLEDPQFAGFLRTTRDLTPQNLNALLSLKQSADERDLPELGRFRELLSLGNFGEAGKIVEGATEEQRDKYIERIPKLFQDELTSGSFQTARNILEAGLGSQPLGVGDKAAAAMVDEALVNHRVHEDLWRIAPSRVFRALPALSAPSRKKAIEPYLKLSFFATNSPDRVGEVIDALIPLVPDLPSDQKTLLKSELTGDPFVSDRRADYLPLVQKHPDLLTDAIINSAFAELSNQGAAWTLGSPTTQIVIVGLDEGLTPAIADQFVTTLAAPRIEALQSDASRLGETLDETLSAFRRFHSVTQAAAEQFLTQLQSVWSVAPPNSEGQWKLVDIAGALLGATEEGAQVEPRVEWFVNQLFDSDPASGVDYARRRGGDSQANEALLGMLGARLETLITSGQPLYRDAVETLLHLGLPEPQAAERVATGLERLIQQAAYLEAVDLIRTHRNPLQSQRDRVVAAGFAQLGQLPVTSRQTLLEAFVGLDDLLTATERDQITTSLIELMRGGMEGWNVALAVVESAQAPEWLKERWPGLIDATAQKFSDEAFDPSELDLISRVAADQELLQTGTREDFADVLMAWMEADPAYRSHLAPHLGQLTKLSAAKRLAAVSWLVHTEEGDPGNREALLRAAQSLALKSKRAQEVLSARIEELRTSQDETRRTLAESLLNG